MWRATVLTIFPGMFPGPLGASLAGKASQKGLWALEAIDIRDFATDRHRTVDDTPAGGGPGMILKADVLGRAIDAAARTIGPVRPAGPGEPAGQGGQGEPAEAPDQRPRLLMSARGVPLTQALVWQLAAGPGLVAVCGRFEGVDERVIAGRGLLEISIGDFIVSGGEIAAMALIDACVRLIPGVMGKELSAVEESFSAGLLEHPQFTRPTLWEGRAIPEVLLSGDHGKVAAWRRSQAERLTRERRPDLWEAYLRQRRQDRGGEGTG